MFIQSEIISSRNNELVKWASSLQSKKSRDLHSSFIAEGHKLSFEAIDANLPVTHVFIMESKKDEFIPKLLTLSERENLKETRAVILSDSAFMKISTEKAPQGIITVIKYLDFFSRIDIIYKEEFFVLPSERVIVLSSLRDPSNLGAVIRSAVAFGVDHIILSSDCADLYGPKTVRAAMGSLFRVKASVVSDMCEFIRAMQANGRKVYAAELSDNAKSLKDIDLSSHDAVIIGNEGHGIDKYISAVCDASVYIPISKKTESLNASVAAALFMWEQSN